MAASQYSSRLRFVDAEQLPEADVKLDHLPIYGWAHEKLGNLDGFIVDAESGAVQYQCSREGDGSIPIASCCRSDTSTASTRTRRSS